MTGCFGLRHSGTRPEAIRTLRGQGSRWIITAAVAGSRRAEAWGSLRAALALRRAGIRPGATLEPLGNIKMANLGSLDLATTLKESAGMLICARLLLDRVVQRTSLPRQDLFREIIEFMIGELERCVAAAHRTQSLELASGTRKLFELSLFVDYLCTSVQRSCMPTRSLGVLPTAGSKTLSTLSC
jgi:hypothetical protein